MISLISRLNFTKTTSFNLVLFVNIDDVKTVKERMKEGGAVDTQTAHFYVTNGHRGRERTGIYKVFVQHCTSLTRFIYLC